MEIHERYQVAYIMHRLREPDLGWNKTENLWHKAMPDIPCLEQSVSEV